MEESVEWMDVMEEGVEWEEGYNRRNREIEWKK